MFPSAIIDALPSPFYVIDKGNRMVCVNRKFCQVSGFAMKEILKKSPPELFVLKDRKLIKERIHKAFRDGSASAEVSLLTKGGKVLPYYFTGERILFEGRVFITGIGTDMQQYKNLESELIRDKKELQRYLNIVGVMIVVLDKNGRVMRVNKKCTHILGYKEKDIIGKDWFANFIPKRLRQEVRGVFNKLISGELYPVEYFENQVVNRSKDERLIAWHNTFLRDRKNNIIAILSSEEDITERRQIEDELKRSKEFFRIITEESSEAVVIVDKKGMIKYISPSIEGLLGYKPKEMIGKSGFKFIDRIDLPRAMLAFGRAVVTKNINIPNAFRVRHKDGSVRIFEGVGRSYLDNPLISGFVMNVRDVTQQFAAEQELRDSEERFRAIFDNANDGLLIADPQTRKFIYSNRKICSMLGYTKEELLKMGVGQIHPGESLKAVSEQFEKQMNKEIVLAKDTPMKRKDGSVFYADISASPVNIRSKSYLMGIFRDTSDRKRMDEELRDSEEKFKLLFEHAPDAYFLIDINGIFIDGNLAAEQVTGYKKPEILGKHFLKAKLFSPEMVPKAAALVAKVLSGRQAEPEEIILDRKDGRKVVLEVKLLPVKLKGQLLVLGMARDITKRKETENELKRAYSELREAQSQLMQSSKMSALGQLASGVAHEINNPLTGVLNNAQLIKMMLNQKDKNIDEAELNSLLSVVEESALRCKKITRSLLDFSHSAKGEFKYLFLNDVVEKTLSLVQQELKLCNIKLEKALSADLPRMKGDFQLLQQVVFGLITNAKWAIEKTPSRSGTIIIKTWYEPQGKVIKLSVSDTGIGIPEENIPKLFTPFFTTKDVGEGTGLGLALIFNIVRSHNGKVEVESVPGKGTAFLLSFLC